jgi:hypothetical protein
MQMPMFVVGIFVEARVKLLLIKALVLFHSPMSARLEGTGCFLILQACEFYFA